MGDRSARPVAPAIAELRRRRHPGAVVSLESVAMYAGRNRRLGFLYVLPALLFVLVFTAYPFIQMVWMSFHSWSLIKPPKFIGLNNFARLYEDEQFWTSLALHLQVHPDHHAHPDDRRLPAGAADGSQHAPPAVHPGDGVRPVVIGLGASSLLWLWLFNPDCGPINRVLMDLGLIDRQPIQWLGMDADCPPGRSSSRSPGRSSASA